MEKESDFHGVNYYVVIPQEVLHDNRLTPLARLIYGEISALANITGFAWISNGKLADKYGVSKPTISVTISKLQELGYIRSKIFYKDKSKEIERRELYINPIQKNLNTPIRKNKIPSLEKTSEPIKKNLKENNTINNTINNKRDVVDSSTVVNFYENNIGSLTGYIAERITEWLSEHSQEMVLKAMQIAVDNGARKVGYINSILSNWKKSGIKNISDLEAHESKRSNKSQFKKVTKEAPEWSQKKYVDNTSADQKAKFEAYKAKRKEEKNASS
ncbi:DnaD domain protein [Lactococcus garvieae]|uniref:DnaD domain protein n=1 Tax=Lactococcus garvieae TaxID=1363 RepID=UPI001CE27497|nr:DnaD domain protein [Lactococcus garvieae]